MHGISQKKANYKAQWTRGIWVGKDSADQDMIIVENDKILKSRAVLATGLFWSKGDLLNMVATPDNLLKIATQTRGTYPVIPPIQCLPARSDDGDPPDKHDVRGGQNMDLPPVIGVPASTKKSRERSDEVLPLPIESRSPFTQPELSRVSYQLPFSAGILPDGGEGPVKRSMEWKEVMALETSRNLKLKLILKSILRQMFWKAKVR